MGYNIDSAEWPTAVEVPPAVKQLIERFFQLLDSTDQNTGNVLADEIFTEDGVAHFSNGPFRGTEEIRKSRDNAWTIVTMRKHEVLKVYASTGDVSDLLFIGLATMAFTSGKTAAGEFVGRLSIKSPQTECPKLSLYQIWADPSAFVKALQGY